MLRYAKLMPTMEAPDAGEVVNPSRFDGLRGTGKRKARPVIGIDVMRRKQKDDDALAAADTTPGTPEHSEPTHNQIARRAYEIYRAREGRPGSPESDWTQALRELTAEA